MRVILTLSLMFWSSIVPQNIAFSVCTRYHGTGVGLKLRVLDEGPDCGRALRRRPSVPPEKLEPCSWGLRLCVWFSETMLLSNLVAMNVARQQLLWCHAAGGAHVLADPLELLWSTAS